jgi:hypothetical protein
VLPWGKARREERLDLEGLSPETAAKRPDSIEAVNPFVLLIPTEGGLSFRLLTVRDVGAARVVIAGQAIAGARQRAIIFRALHQPPQVTTELERPAEVVVMTRDPARTGIVHLSSFVDMNSARSFLQFEAQRGVDLHNVLLYWALPDTIEPPAQYQSAAPPEPGTRVQPVRVPVATPEPRVSAPVNSEHVAVAATRRDVGAEALASSKPAAEPSESTVSRVRAWPGWQTLRYRMAMASLLKGDVYEDVKQDQHAIGQVAVILSVTALATAIGAFWGGPKAMIVYTLASPIGWALYAATSYWVGTQVFRGRDKPWSLGASLTAFGFASSPRLFFLLALVPIYGPLFVLLVLVWVAVSTTFAAKQALELDDADAAVTAMISTLALFAASIVAPSLIV